MSGYRKMRLALIGLAAAALIAVVVIGLSQAPESSTTSPKSRQELDPATLKRAFAGSPPQLTALHDQANELLGGGQDAFRARLRELRGHPVVVNVWGAWCEPCRAELPVFQQISVDYGRRVAFLGVDLEDSRGAATKLLRQIPLTYPSYEDPKGRIFNSYGVKGVPSTVFYDASGEERFIHQGPYLERRDLEDDIRRYALGEGA